MIVARRARRLDQKNVPPPHVVFQLAKVLPVGKLAQRDGGGLEMQVLANLETEFGIGLPAEDLQFPHDAATTA
jgi:hypothetical protein